MVDYDFCGWATKANIKCADGRTIMTDAFAQNHGQKVPLVWNHQHNDPNEVLGYAYLENRPEGVYAYGKFNDTDSGQTAKLLVQHGDVDSMSIYANGLKHQNANVTHGNIREVSLVLAGANKGAKIESVIAHGEDSDQEAYISFGDTMILGSDDDNTIEHSEETKTEEETVVHIYKKNSKWRDTISHSDEPQEKKEMADEKKERTVKDVLDTMNEEQLNVCYALVGQALQEQPEGGKEEVKHNIFDNDEKTGAYLSHSDEEAILALAKSNACGSFQAALEAYVGDAESLAHGIDDIDQLFPDYKDVRPGAPELIERDQGWVSVVMNGVHKSPISRIRTRWTDARDTDLTAFGYKKGHMKQNAGNLKLMKRTTDPQTVYRKDALHRDDIIDITEFDVVEYQYGIMKNNLNEELATAIMIGDGRDDGDEMKISEEHIRPIWTDDDLYTIHYDIDLEAAASEIQGSDTDKHFGDNYIYSEAFVNAALYSREKYKGSGNLTFFCEPHLLNVMLLARDYNGRRIYSSKTELEAALNVKSIVTVEQFANKTRTVSTASGNKTKKLLGLFVNLSDYQVGSTKGGEITRFSQFDIDFNQEKYLIETRLSGALTRLWSAIAIEEDITNQD